MWGRLSVPLLILVLPLGANAPSEYDLKAAYLFNILRFAEPQNPRSGEFFTLGVHAAGPIESSLRALEGTRLHGRKLRLRTVNEESELRDCDVLFLGRSNGPAARLLAQAGSAHILAVGNDSAFIAMGGMMALVIESRRIVVEINEPAVAAAGWVLSSYLLEVARIVKGAGR